MPRANFAFVRVAAGMPAPDRDAKGAAARGAGTACGGTRGSDPAPSVARRNGAQQARPPRPGPGPLPHGRGGGGEGADRQAQGRTLPLRSAGETYFISRARWRDPRRAQWRDCSMRAATRPTAMRSPSRCEDDRHHFRFIVSPEDAGFGRPPTRSPASFCPTWKRTWHAPRLGRDRPLEHRQSPRPYSRPRHRR